MILAQPRKFIPLALEAGYLHSVTDAQPAGKKGALASATAPRQGTKAGEDGERRLPDPIAPSSEGGSGQ